MPVQRCCATIRDMKAFSIAISGSLSLLLGLSDNLQAKDTPVFQTSVPVDVMQAREARQGVASDGTAIYVIDNSVIGKYRIADHAFIARFEGTATELPHLNSCTMIEGELVCASSNYPATPQRGTVEVFDPVTLAHKRSVPMPENPGSLTTIGRRSGKWWAVFANYDGKGGVPGRDHRTTLLAQLGDDFTIERRYSAPATILERIAPYSISGAAWGTGGRLYLSGHDKPEIYVVQLPPHGDVLIHQATLATASFGQAIDIDPLRPDVIWSIDRNTGRVFASVLPVCKGTP